MSQNDAWMTNLADFRVGKEKTVKNNSTGRFAFLGVAPIWDGALAVNYFLSAEASYLRSIAKKATTGME